MLVAAPVVFRNPWFHGNFGVVDQDRVYRSAQPEGELRQLIATHGEGTFDRLDAIAATEAGDKGVGEGRLREIKRDRVVDDACEPGGRGCPTFGTACLVEPGMHDLKLPAEAFRWHRDPHTNRKSLLCLALHPHRRSLSRPPPFMFRSKSLYDRSNAVETPVEQVDGQG